jgi:aspartyl-tRNA(Asn)/glutamyl-tRNA(Gln) amidotransferase subunit C
MAAVPPENSAPRIASDEVKITAEMARLHIASDAELQALTGELSRILDLAAHLAEVNVEGIEPTTHAVPLFAPLRDDVVGPHIDIEGAIRNAPATEATFFTVPAILTSGDEG